MSIGGSLVDIAIVDLLQFVHMSQRSGTLLLERNSEQAHISFHRGRIASAWSPRSPSVASYLVQQGKLTKEQLEWIVERQRTQPPTRSLGKALLEEGTVSWSDLREAVATKVEHTVYELIGWRDGTFSLLADEVRVDDDITFAPGDVLPEVDIDTQGILLEAVRLFDERSRDAGAVPSLPNPAVAVPPIVAPHLEVVPEVKTPGQLRVQLLSNDPEALRELRTLLDAAAQVDNVELRDAGAVSPGEHPPLVVIDLRPGQQPLTTVKRVREVYPRAPIIGLVAAATESARVFAAGAAAVAETSYLATCCTNLLRSRSISNEDADLALRSGLGRLRRVIGDLRSGLLSATVSLNLMTIVADSVERAMLFVQRRDALVALGAFGATNDSRPLAVISRGLSLHLDPGSAVARCVVNGQALTVEYDSDQLPEELKRIVDRPRSGEGVLFPVLGARRAIGFIYADNGRRAYSVKDVELMELATAQMGLAFENELLRRQLAQFERLAV
jgi:hypothetical protein